MKLKRVIAIGALASTALVCAVLVVAQEQRPAPPAVLARQQAVETSRDSHLTGVNVVRLINTAEIDYRQSHGRYAKWDELVPSGSMTKFERPGTPFQGLQLVARPEVTPGWILDLVTAADGQSYELSLRNSADACGFSFFSDQRGIIFQGGYIDCSVELKPPSGD